MLLRGPDQVRGDRFKAMRRFTLSSFSALNTRSEQYTELQMDSKMGECKGLSSSLRGAEYCGKEWDFSPDCGLGQTLQSLDCERGFQQCLLHGCVWELAKLMLIKPFFTVLRMCRDSHWGSLLAVSL